MSSLRLILPADTEFLDGLRFLCDDGLLADLKRQLVPIALDVIRNSLVGHTHPLETLQSLGDMHWQLRVCQRRQSSRRAHGHAIGG